MSEKKYIFLDIDGVLNSHYFCLEEKKEIDSFNVKILNEIVEFLDANIVISSTWRKHYSISEIGNILTKFGFLYSDKIVDFTPVFNSPRGTEIEFYIDSRGISKKNIVILDDCYDMESLMDRLVLTCYWIKDGGLREIHFEKVKKLFST